MAWIVRSLRGESPAGQVTRKAGGPGAYTEFGKRVGLEGGIGQKRGSRNRNKLLRALGLGGGIGEI